MWLTLLLAVVVSVLLSTLCNLLWPFLLGKKNLEEHFSGSTENLAEIDGGVWERVSVFSHIEQGLRKNPNGPAVISVFQSSDSLPYVVREDEITCKSTTVDSSSQKPNGVTPVEKPSFPFGASRFSNGTAVDQHNEGQNDNQNESREGESNQKLPSKYLTITYGQLHCTALKLAAGMLANGARSNTSMLMIIPNCGEYCLLLWACILLRITYISLDPALLDISGFTMLKATIKTLRPQIVITPDALTGKSVEAAVSELRLPRPLYLCLSSCSVSKDCMPLVDLVHDASKVPINEESLVMAARSDNQNRIHSIMFTSGTSGLPKGCPMRVSNMSHMLHSQSWLVDSEAGAFALQQPHNSRGIAPAQTLQTWKAGGAVVMTGQEFNVRQALKAIIQLKVTFIVLTPPMVHEMAAELATAPIDVNPVKRIQVGGDAITKGLLLKTASLFPNAQVCVNHGMTEGGGSFLWPLFTCPISGIPFFGEICPIGVVAPGATIRIWDTDKKCVVRKGQLGELHISSGSLIKHYLGGRSEESFYNDKGGRWFNTGDVAMVNEDGLVSILGRKRDMIKRAGVAIMPAALESSITAFTAVQVSNY
jgi:acyl-CoA synthetase (AMP-forming)/AMP-acid ligase II